jgi:uncharacterized protein
MCRYKASQYNHSIRRGDAVVLYNFLTKALLEISAQCYDTVKILLHDPNSISSLDNDVFLLLRSQGFIVPSNNDEIDIIKYCYYSSLFGEGSNQLTLVILPTMWCNLRCPYCFEMRRKEFMEDETQHKLLEFVDYKLQYAKSLYVAWFGGEPLLCKSTIEKLTKGFQLTCKQHHSSYRAGVTTNGYLLDSGFIKSLEELGIDSLQVTFDGAPKHHDSYRVLSDGKGTFDTIRRNTEDLCRLTRDDFQLIMRVNCSEDNFKDIPNLLNLFSIGVKKKARIFFRWVYSTEASGFTDFTCGIPKKDKFRILADLSQKAMGLGWSLDNPADTTPLYCEVDNTNFFQISPKGDVFLCSETYKPEESVGNVSEWTKLVSLPSYAWYAANPFDDPDCLKCILLPYCMGGCRKSRVAGTKSCVDELNDVDALVRVLYENSLKHNVAA